MTAMPLMSDAPALPAVRQRYAIEMLRHFGVVRCHELESRFGISEATARRDIDAVVRRGNGVRVYGGAVLSMPSL